MPIIRLLLLASILSLAACAGPEAVSQSLEKSHPEAVAPASTTKQASIIATARQQLGTPYRYGGSTPTGFDCSGLVSYAYHSVGIQVPRTSSEQFRQAAKVPLKKLRPGDLLFFRLSPPKISHVAIYDRGGRFIHAPSSGKRVSYASLENPYWRKHLVGAGRF